MVKTKEKTEYRDGTLGWWLMEAGWSPVEVLCNSGGSHKLDAHGRCEHCRILPHPLWRYEEFGPRLTGWEARRLELLRIHDEFKRKASNVH
jgi:hypothetical protein